MTSAISHSASAAIANQHQRSQASSRAKSRYEFVKVDRKSPHFDRLSRIFNEKLAPARGNQDEQIRKTGEAREIRAEMLMRKGCPAGMLTYKLSGNRRNTFEVPTMVVLSEEASRIDQWGKMLVERAIKLAKREKAHHVDVSTFSKSSMRGVLADNGFEVDQRLRDNYVKGVTEYLYTKKVESVEAVSEKGKALIRGEEISNNARGTSLRRKREREGSSADSRDTGGKKGAAEKADGSRAGFRRPQTERSNGGGVQVDFGNRRPRTEDLAGSYEYKPYVRKGPRYSGGPRAAAARGPAPERTKHRITLMAKYLLQIQKGWKTIEGRINSGMMKQLKVGHEVTWYSRGLEVKTKIVAIRNYDSFRNMLAAEGVQNCLADVQDLDVGDLIYKRIPGYSARAAQHGVLAIQLQLI